LISIILISLLFELKNVQSEVSGLKIDITTAIRGIKISTKETIFSFIMNINKSKFVYAQTNLNLFTLFI